MPIPKLTGWPILTTSPDFEKILNQTRKNQKSTRKAYMIPGIKPECAIQSNKKANESSDKINQTLATPVIINRINGTPPQNPISEPVTPTKFRNETEISLANKTPSSKSQGRRLTEANQKLLLNQVEEYLNSLKVVVRKRSKNHQFFQAAIRELIIYASSILLVWNHRAFKRKKQEILWKMRNFRKTSS